MVLSIAKNLARPIKIIDFGEATNEISATFVNKRNPLKGKM